MEQKKTLWIIAAVGTFLLVVLGAACIFYTPAVKNNSTVASVAPVEKYPQNPQTGWSNSSIDSVRTQTQAPVYSQNEIAASKVNDMVVLADNATVYEVNKEYTNAASNSPEGTTIDLNALKRELYQESPSVSQPQNINITVNIPETTTTKETTYITTTPEYKPETEKAAAVAVASTPVQKTVKKAEQPKAKTTSTTVTTKTVTKAAPAPEAKKITQYWVQVAAYSNKKGAEGARSTLDSNKIQADIFTYKDNKDKLFYRVRVGPYTTKSEAEYWRTKIVKIDEFAKAESYVTSTTN